MVVSLFSCLPTKVAIIKYGFICCTLTRGWSSVSSLGNAMSMRGGCFGQACSRVLSLVRSLGPLRAAWQWRCLLMARPHGLPDLLSENCFAELASPCFSAPELTTGLFLISLSNQVKAKWPIQMTTCDRSFRGHSRFSVCMWFSTMSTRGQNTMQHGELRADSCPRSL